jgi:hypothetical protein
MWRPRGAVAPEPTAPESGRADPAVMPCTVHLPVPGALCDPLRFPRPLTVVRAAGVIAPPAMTSS